jgi:steroid delta-isomerase-like uncharacterized protein
MSSELNKTMARSYFEAYSTRDIDAVMKFIGPDYLLHPGASGESMNSDERRRDEMVFFKAFSDIQAVVEDQIAENGKVANRITMYCTHSGEYQGVPATGKRIAIPYIDITLFKAGKIVEEWVEYDTINILRQIRVSESQR